jgi:hypothetical protein
MTNQRKEKKDDTKLIETLKRIVDSEAEAGEDLLFEDQTEKDNILKKEDVISEDTAANKD